MLLEGTANMLMKFLRIPPGVSLRHAGEVTTSSGGYGGGAQGAILDNPYIDTILSITVDDICIGEDPLSVSVADNCPELVNKKLEEICDEFNTVVKDVAWDLCTQGYSVYKTSLSSKNKLILLPYIENVVFYLTKEKEVVVCDEENNPLDAMVVFLNYNRRGLVKIEDTDLSGQYAFSIMPEPMQLKNVAGTVNSLNAAENNLDRFRALMSRPIRLVNVDIGAAQGDQQKDVVDTIASAINANSGSLPSVTGGDTFDDNIPVLPHRNGKGKAEVYDNVPNYELDKIGDIEHYINKLALVTRFPGSYLDFSTSLDQTTASLLRGDIRYYKLCNKVRSKIVDTINEFVNASEKFRKYNPCFILTQLPTSEDEDVMDALDKYIDIADRAEGFVIGEQPMRDMSIHRLQLLQDLFAASTTSPTLQKWFQDFRDFIEKMLETPMEEMGGEGGDEFGGGGDLGGGDDFGGGELEGGDDFGSEDLGGGDDLGGGEAMEFEPEKGAPSDVEFINEDVTSL